METKARVYKARIPCASCGKLTTRGYLTDPINDPEQTLCLQCEREMYPTDADD